MSKKFDAISKLPVILLQAAREQTTRAIVELVRDRVHY